MVNGMYESPIELLVTDIQHQIVKQQDEEIYQAVLHFIPDVDRTELLRALQYDRNQYGKGYADGKADAMAELVRCKDCEKQRICRHAQYLGDNGFCSYGERGCD